MFLLRALHGTVLFGGAAVLVALPFVVAADYGGVLRWTQYVSALAILLAMGLAVIGWIRPEGRSSFPQQSLLLPLLIWFGYAHLQAVSLPPSVVGVLSPASVQAYTDWVNPLLGGVQSRAFFPISISPHDSMHAAAMLGVTIGAVWAASSLFCQRPRVLLLLSAMAVGSALHVAYGLARIVFPEFEMWGIGSGNPSTGFGAFVNRNNAALLLNLGLAASLGLLTWRMTALGGFEVDDPSFELSDLFSLASDRESIVGLIGAVLCIAGLLVCGSRGGLLAAFVGLLLSFGWIRQRRGFLSLPVIGTVVTICVALLLVPLRLETVSVRRLEGIAKPHSSLLSDGRLLHWRDGLETAFVHLPSGSGLASYGYAYLPHQKTSPGNWFHHADNLWLELLVEQGVVGVLLAVSIAIILIRSLSRLGQSPDAIDHGLRTTGWYCLGAILVSQWFDFGLIVPGNLLLVAVLFAAIVSRSHLVDVRQPRRSRGHRLRSVTTLALAIGVIAIVASGLPRLKQNAEVESITRLVDVRLQAFDDPEALRELSERIREFANDDPRLLLSRAQLEYVRARIKEAEHLAPESSEQATEYYRETGPFIKRRGWLQQSGSPPGEAVDTEVTRFGYELPVELARQSLQQLPLSFEARSILLYMDFVHQDPEITQAALEQLTRLHSRDGSALVVIARFAADSGKSEMAADLWREALTANPTATQRVLQLLEMYPEISMANVIPQTPVNYRAVAPFLLRGEDGRQAMLETVYAGLACDSCESVSDQARCEELSGDVAYALGQFENAFTDYRAAIDLDPLDADVRLKLVRRLREQGQRNDALLEARKGRVTIDADSRFDEIIREMAQADLDELQEND